ncbi:hypothetical protein [Leucobacter chromiireducens]|uniref:hypothetical protein n=1 Tax=Leucobacter chromiireducens TaxID=283877 RepID=UPI003F7EFECB
MTYSAPTLSPHPEARHFHGISPENADVRALAEIGVTGPDAHLIARYHRDVRISYEPAIERLPTLAERIQALAERAVRTHLGECETRVPDADIAALIPTAAVLVGAREPYASKADAARRMRELKRRAAALRRRYGTAA